MVGATRRPPPSCRGLTEHQRHEARRAPAVVTWTWDQAAWLSTPCTWLTENHVALDVPTTWPRSVPRKVAPQLTTTVGWPTAGDRQGRVRAGLSLLLDRPAGPVAQTGWRPPGAPWSCDLNAAATSPGDLLRAGACAWWLSCCSALRLPACSPGASLAFQSTQIGYLVHPGCPKVSIGCGLGDRTSHAPGLRGGSYIGSGTVPHHK